jgi:hypothetical protein
MNLLPKLPKIVRADGQKMTVRGQERRDLIRKGGFGKDAAAKKGGKK